MPHGIALLRCAALCRLYRITYVIVVLIRVAIIILSLHIEGGREREREREIGIVSLQIGVALVPHRMKPNYILAYS